MNRPRLRAHASRIIGAALAVAVLTALTSVSTAVAATPALTLTKSTGPPTTQTKVSGTGFGPNEVVDIYVDLTDVRLAVTDASGAFSGAAVTIPASAVPGTHWITGIGRASGSAAQQPFVVRTDWAGDRNTPNHKGDNAFENVLGASNVGSLTESWSSTVSSFIDAPPADVGGVVYIGAIDHKLYALDEATGAVLWSSVTLEGPLDGSPVVSGGIVYAGSSNLSAFPATCSTPCAPLWTSIAMGEFFGATVSNGRVFVGSTDGNVYAYDAAGVTNCSGTPKVCAPIWTGATGTGVSGSPAVANGNVYVGSGRYVWAFPVGCSGACTAAWQTLVGGTVTGSVAVAGGVVYAGDNRPELSALGAISGAFRWQSGNLGGPVQSPAVAGGLVFATGGTKLWAFSAACGTTCGVALWSDAVTNGVNNAPAVANGVVYLADGHDRLFAFPATCGTPSCAPLWTAQTPGLFESSPVPANGTLFAGVTDGSVYAYRPAVRTAPPTRPDPRALRPDRSLKIPRR